MVEPHSSGRVFVPYRLASRTVHTDLGGSAVLEFVGAGKRFGALCALDNCSSAARPGRLTGFLGPNGAGETTAMPAMSGLVKLDCGAVRWRGRQSVRPSGPGSAICPRSGGCTRACESVSSCSISASCAAAIPSDVGRSVDLWLERRGLSDRTNDRLEALSHGNQQRVQLIAALVNESELLVLDEPFSGLDPPPWRACPNCRRGGGRHRGAPLWR